MQELNHNTTGNGETESSFLKAAPKSGGGWGGDGARGWGGGIRGRPKGGKSR